MFQSDLFPACQKPQAVPLACAIGAQIAERLASGRHLTRADISALFAGETGVQDWGSAWTIDDYNNAIEIGSLLWLRGSSRIDLTTGFHEAEARFDWLEAALPSRHVRSEGQIELQQFSTPPILAWLLAKAAALSSRDTLLEPSAGNGAFAIWADGQAASLTLNEIDARRRDSLANIFSKAAISSHDGELIADLHRGPIPSVVLMNPPFARSAERGSDGGTALRHLRSAIRVCARGGRIAAIMPDGFDASRFAKAQDKTSLLLDVRLQRMFARTGTGIAVRLVVFDKVPAGKSRPITGDTSELSQLHALLAGLSPRALISADIHRLPVRTLPSPVEHRTAIRPSAPFAMKPASGADAAVLSYAALSEAAPVPEQAGIYLPYRPSRIEFADAPMHPTPLVESVAMGSVAAPVPKVRPLLPANSKADKLLSAAQCETLIYACQAFDRDLPGQFRPSQEGTMLELSEDGQAYRQGFFLGDGTGAGKGRQIAAVMMDRWLAGERRHVWITKNEALLEDARRDWEALGGLPLDIQPLSRWKLGRPVTLPKGILFVTYPTLRSGRAEDTRLDQILAWAGEEFEGVIAFDESHAMANALGSSSTHGKVKGSEQGMAGLRLQNHLPRARVLYASATGASDIANLGYAARLGLWGPETAFPSHETFMTDIRAGGVAAMELVARDLKAQGLYLSRALSFAGVEYDILEHCLTEAQIRIYDAYADAWAIIHRNLEAALEATRLVSLEVKRHLRPLRLKRLVRMHEIGSLHAIPLRNARSGKVALSVPARRLIADDGAVIERRRLLRPLKSANWTIEALGESLWEEIGVTEFTKVWRTEEDEAAASPVTERLHLATGLLLPVWKRLPGDHVCVTRLVAEDGSAVIGREVLDVDLAKIAETFGLAGVAGPLPDELGKLVLASGTPQPLASHDAVIVKRSLVGGEQRLELTGYAPDRLDWYKTMGCFTEIIRYRTRLFVPVSKASIILPALAV